MRWGLPYKHKNPEAPGSQGVWELQVVDFHWSVGREDGR